MRRRREERERQERTVHERENAELDKARWTCGAGLRLPWYLKSVQQPLRGGEVGDKRRSRLSADRFPQSTGGQGEADAAEQTNAL